VQYRLANPDNEFDPSPTVIVPYSTDASGGGQFKYDASAVELADGRVLYCWSWRQSTAREIRTGHAASVDDFFAASNSITYDKPLITAAFSNNVFELRGLINPDPYVGNARLWLQVYMERPNQCTFDASVEDPGITLDGQHLWTSEDQGATWDYVTNLWYTQTNRGTLGGPVRLLPPENIGPGASYANPYPVGNPLSVVVNSYRQNTSANNRRKAAVYVSTDPTYATWDMKEMFPRAEPPSSTSFDYWRDDALPLTTTLANQYDLGWLPNKVTKLYCSMDVPLDPNNENAGQQSGSSMFLGITGGAATNARSWFCRTSPQYVTPTHRITAGQPGRPENGAAFTIHGHPNVVFWFDTNGRLLYSFNGPQGFPYMPHDGSAIPADQIASPFELSTPIWSGLGTSGEEVNVMKVGDRLAFMWGSNLIGIALYSPRCKPLPPLHIPYKDWRREKDKRRSAQMALDNTHAVETWAREVFDAGNTSTRLHIPVSNKGYSQYQFWLSVERWTGTLCNRDRVHIPHKRIKSKDETNFLALERWAGTVNPNDGPF